MTGGRSRADLRRGYGSRAVRASALAAIAALAVTALVGLRGPEDTSTAAAVDPVAVSASSAAPDPAAPPAVAPTVKRPPIRWDPIPFGRKRQRQMVGYVWRHYGQRAWKMTRVRQIVLHYTVTSTYGSVHNFFSANGPAPGPAGTRSEPPGVCTQFVIDKAGRIYQLTPVKYMCRQAIGLNNQSVGIEFVEESSARNILHRPKQLRAGLALVRWLQSELGIGKTDVIGHGMVNKSRFFRDRKGWYNDHEDWGRGDVRRFRRFL